MGRIQLLQWGFKGKLRSYALQSSLLPTKTLKLLQSLSHRFIWGNLREETWSDIALPCSKGGLSLKCYFDQQLVVAIERVGRIWSHSDVWARWMRDRYARQQELACIHSCMMIPLNGVSFSNSGQKSRRCYNATSNYKLDWSGEGEHLSLANAWKTIRKHKAKIQHWKGI